MNEFDGAAKKKISETLRASLLMLGFGVTILALLIAIDRPHWFVLRPVSGAAMAMAKASAAPNPNIASPGTQERPGVEVPSERSSE